MIDFLDEYLILERFGDSLGRQRSPTSVRSISTSSSTLSRSSINAFLGAGKPGMIGRSDTLPERPVKEEGNRTLRVRGNE